MRPLSQSVRIKPSLSIGSDTAFDRTLAATSRELSEDIFSRNKRLRGCSLFFFYFEKKCHPVLIKLSLLQRCHSFLKQKLANVVSAPPHVVFRGSLMQSPPALLRREEHGTELGELNVRRLYVLVTLPRRKVEVST